MILKFIINRTNTFLRFRVSLFFYTEAPEMSRFFFHSKNLAPLDYDKKWRAEFTPRFALPLATSYSLPLWGSAPSRFRLVQQRHLARSTLDRAPWPVDRPSTAHTGWRCKCAQHPWLSKTDMTQNLCHEHLIPYELGNADGLNKKFTELKWNGETKNTASCLVT
jgi:hypothetical protein